jgi:hypothetical protein
MRKGMKAQVGFIAIVIFGLLAGCQNDKSFEHIEKQARDSVPYTKEVPLVRKNIINALSEWVSARNLENSEVPNTFYYNLEKFQSGLMANDQFLTNLFLGIEVYYRPESKHFALVDLSLKSKNETSEKIYFKKSFLCDFNWEAHENKKVRITEANIRSVSLKFFPALNETMEAFEKEALRNGIKTYQHDVLKMVEKQVLKRDHIFNQWLEMDLNSFTELVAFIDKPNFDYKPMTSIELENKKQKIQEIIDIFKTDFVFSFYKNKITLTSLNDKEDIELKKIPLENKSIAALK